jgi:hypothetical protein
VDTDRRDVTPWLGEGWHSRTVPAQLAIEERPQKARRPRKSLIFRGLGLVAGGRFAFTATAYLDLCFVVVV